MIHIGFLSLSVIFRISFSQNRFFLRNGEPEETTEMNGPDFNEDEDVDKIVIDLYYISYVQFLGFDDDANETIKRVYTVYIGDTKRYENDCPRDAETSKVQFKCNRLARVVVIEGENIKGRQRIVSDDTGLTNYVGCFETAKVNVDPEERTFQTYHECFTACLFTSFHALTMDKKCYCLEDTLGMVQVKMQLCNKKFEEKPFLYHGGDGYVSVYAKSYDIIHQHHDEYGPSFDCIFHNRRCAKCPKGRKGFNCEHIACQENNGNCGIMACNVIVIEKQVTMARCICKEGFDEDYICQDKNETLKEEEEIPLEIPLIAYGLVILAIIGTLITVFIVINVDFESYTSSSSHTTSSA